MKCCGEEVEEHQMISRLLMVPNMDGPQEVAVLGSRRLNLFAGSMHSLILSTYLTIHQRRMSLSTWSSFRLRIIGFVTTDHN